MKNAKRKKLVICAEYQGEGALQGTATGFQRTITEWINCAGREDELDIVLFCIGAERKEMKHPQFSNVRIRQYKPNLDIRWIIPFVPSEMMPFLVDALPFHFFMIKDIIDEKPDIIHTFQTFGASDIAGFIAAKIMKKILRAEVRLVCTVMTEVETYLFDYFRLWISNLYEQMASNSLGKIICNSARTVLEEEKCAIRKKKMILHALPITFWYSLATFFDYIGKIRDCLRNKRGTKKIGGVKEWIKRPERH